MRYIYWDLNFSLICNNININKCICTCKFIFNIVLKKFIFNYIVIFIIIIYFIYYIIILFSIILLHLFQTYYYIIINI